MKIRRCRKDEAVGLGKGLQSACWACLLQVRVSVQDEVRGGENLLVTSDLFVISPCRVETLMGEWCMTMLLHTPGA